MFGFHCMRRKKNKFKEDNNHGMQENEFSSDLNPCSDVNSFPNDEQNKSLFSQCFRGSKKCSKDEFTESLSEEMNGKNVSLQTNDHNMVQNFNHNTVPASLESSTIISHQESLAEKVFRLVNYGWYWGPLSYAEASAKLQDESDGSFLVRDSSCEQYVLTLSFRSHGHTFHTRIDHLGGMFSIQTDLEFNTVEDLIKHSMTHSLLANGGDPLDNNNFTIKLTHPISRFTQVRPLQYLCRFVIRHYIRADMIPKLPLPHAIVKYVEEGQF